ncbi:hypothetical protein D3C73_1370840 [compost metagenome]
MRRRFVEHLHAAVPVDSDGYVLKGGRNASMLDGKIEAILGGAEQGGIRCIIIIAA